MKTLNMLIYILSLVILSSCKDEEDKKYCYDCTTQTTVTGSPSQSVTISKCDLTEKDAGGIESAGTYVATTSGITVNTKTTCRKK